MNEEDLNALIVEVLEEVHGAGALSLVVTAARATRLIPVIGFLLVACAPADSSEAPDEDVNVLRHERVVDAIVRVETGESNGTGFLVEGGLVATNYHIVQLVRPIEPGKIEASFQPSITITFRDGSTSEAKPLKADRMRDLALLRPKRKVGAPLKLGKFDGVKPGQEVYLAGYPFAEAHPVVAFGHLSTKWKASLHLGSGEPRDVAWLDATMNAGNSGGPVVVLGAHPDQDRVVCVATFNLNPYGKAAAKVEDFARKSREHGTVAIMGIDVPEFAQFVGGALKSNSLGVGGCVSIDYLVSML